MSDCGCPKTKVFNTQEKLTVLITRVSLGKAIITRVCLGKAIITRVCLGKASSIEVATKLSRLGCEVRHNHLSIDNLHSYISHLKFRF